MIRKWIFYILLLFMMGLLSILTSFRLFLFLVPVLLFLPFFLFFLLLNQRRKIFFSIYIEEEAEQLFSYSITVKNNGIFPISKCRCRILCTNHFFQEENSMDYTFSLSGKTSRQIQGKLTLPSIGRYSLSLDKIVLYDWFSLFAFSVKKAVKTSFTQWPKPTSYTLSGTLIEEVPQQQDSIGKLGLDFSQISGLREYHPGDRLQSIHWKASSKRNEYVVKEFLQTGSKQITLLAELSYPAPKTVYEAFFSFIFSAAESFLTQDIPFTVNWYSPEEKRLVNYAISNSDELLSMLQDWLSIPVSRYGRNNLSEESLSSLENSQILYLSCRNIRQNPSYYEQLFSQFSQSVSIFQPECSAPSSSNFSDSRVFPFPLFFYRTERTDE